ncbi:MAG: hypothetical protein VKO21_09545 [Candidatus Sericytochromatia bacterium]|nr:hypothetical protein [Candidatus Sericytochromatia bacterium]
MAIENNKRAQAALKTGPLKAPSASLQATAQSPSKLATEILTKTGNGSVADRWAGSRTAALARFNSLPERIKANGDRLRDLRSQIANGEQALRNLRKFNPLPLGGRRIGPAVPKPGISPIGSIIERVQKNISRQQAEVQTLKDQRVKLLEERADDRPDGRVDAGHLKAKDELGKLDVQIEKSEADKLAADSKLAVLQGKKAEQAKVTGDTRAELEGLRGDLAAQRKVIEESRKSTEGLAKDNAELRKRMAGLDADNRKLNEQEQAKGEARRRLLGEQVGEQPLYDALKTLPANTLTEGDVSFLSAFDKRLERINGLSSDIAKLNEQQAANVSKVAAHRGKIRENNRQIEGLRAGIVAAEGEVKGLESKIAGLSDKLGELERASRRLDGEVRSQKAEVGKLTNQLGELDAQRKRAVGRARAGEVQDIRLGEAQVQRLDGEIEGVKSRLETAKSALAQLVEKEEALKSEMAQVRSEVASAKGELDTLKSEETSARTKLAENEKALSGLQAENRTLFDKEQALGKERLELLGQIAAEGPIATALRTLPAAELTEGDQAFLKAFDAASARVTAIGAEVRGLNDQQSANKARIGELKTANEGLKGRISELETSVKAGVAKVAGLEKALKAAEAKVAPLDREIAAAKRELGKLEQQQSKLEADRENWVKELAQDRNELEELK